MTIYQKVIAVVGMLRRSINQRAAKLDLAPNFDPANSYDKDRMVVYEDNLYRCIQAHSGAWNPDDFARCTLDEIIALAVQQSSSQGVPIAPDYDPDVSYPVGFIVIKDGQLQQSVDDDGVDVYFRPITLNDLDYVIDVKNGSPSNSTMDMFLSTKAAAVWNVDVDGCTLVAHLPRVNAGNGAKIIDAIIRIELGTNVSQFAVEPRSATGRNLHIIPSQKNWDVVQEVDEVYGKGATLVLTFTYLGMEGEKESWLVGRVLSLYPSS